MPAIPVMEDEDLAPDPTPVPYIPETPVAPPVPEISSTTGPASGLTEPERQRAIKKSRLRLEQATEDVERLKPTAEKVLVATGLNIREGAAGAVKQTLGNVIRKYTDIVAPPKPHERFSVDYFLQQALSPTLLGLALNSQDPNDPLSLPYLLRETGRLTAAEGSAQLKAAAEETERLGGGPLVSGAASLASTAGASSPALLAGPWGLGAMAVVSGVQSYGQTVEDFKEKLMERDPNLTEQQAFDKAQLPAALAGAATALITRGFGGTERLIEEVMKRGLTKEAIKTTLGSVWKSAAMEFPEEFTDQFAQGLIEKAYVDPDKKIKDIYDEASIAGLSGLALGIGHGTAIHGVTQVAARALGKGPHGEGEKQTTGGLPPVEGQPAGPGTAGQTEAGTTQRRRPGQEGQPPPLPQVQTTSDVLEQAAGQVIPKPKIAAFDSYFMENPDVPQFTIPGIRPGWTRHVSAETARQYGYEVPESYPSFEEWRNQRNQRPPTEEGPQVSFAPTHRIPIQIQEANGNVVEGEFTGYYDLGDPTRLMISIGKKLDNGGMSHGILKAGEKIIGEIPTLEEWRAAQPTDEASKAAATPPLPGEVPTPQQTAAKPLDWNLFSKVENGYRVIDEAKLRAMVEAGQLRGGTASEALLLHLLNRSDLHPREAIKLVTHLTPVQLAQISGSGHAAESVSQKAAASGAYRGLFYTNPGDRTGNIEIVTLDDQGNPITQAEFVRLMVHELGHNNLTSKLRDAPAELQQAAHDLFMYVLQRAQGTVWEKHNATSNLDEFFSEAISNPGFQKFLTTLDYSGRGKVKQTGLLGTVYGQVLKILKSILKLPEFITTLSGKKVDIITALDESMNLSGQLEEVRREARGKAIRNLAPVELTQAQIEAGATEVGRIAEEIYHSREAAIEDLEKLSYERKQFKLARDEIARLTQMAQANVEQRAPEMSGIAPPNPNAGVGISEGQIVVDDQFTNQLRLANVPHNPENVQYLQAELFYERSAHRYNNLREQIDTLQKALQYYTQLGAAPAEIEKINQQLGKLEEQSTKLSTAEFDGHTVAERAGEISDAEGFRQERIAKRDALSLQPVADFFGTQVGAYRQFAEKARAALAMANATRNALTNPEALKAATAQIEGWVNLPTDVRNAIRAGKQLTPEQKQSIFAALGQVFEDFNFDSARMKELADSRIPQLNKQIREQLGKIADAKIQSGMGEVLLNDVLATLDGETGLTGNLSDLAETQALKERVSAIQSFARFLGENVQTNQELFNWLANPSTPKPIIPAGENFGVDNQTLGMILNEVQRNPAFGSAVLALINASNTKLENMPITGLQQIETALATGTEEGQAQAEAIGKRMLRKARAQASLGESSLRDALQQLDAMETERLSLQEGQAMFEQLAASPEFRSTRDAIADSPFGLVEPMLVQNNTESTFKAFGAPGLPSHPELVLGSDRDVHFKAEWFKKTWEWRKKAQEHLNAYDAAVADYNARLAAYNSDPQNNPLPPTPQQLGYDIPKIRGLRDAVKRAVPGAFNELSLNSESKRWKVPWLVRTMNRFALFRQHDFVAKMVGGITGTDLRNKLGDWLNHFLISQGIRDAYKDIPNKRHAALKSHPEFQMNIANYRPFWNELAHEGRKFGSPVRAGFRLPLSGIVVTEADIALLQRERAYEEALRRRVTETNVTQGVRVKTRDRTLVRPGAYVGDEGLPRFIGRQSDSFIADALAAYNIPPPPGSPKGTPPTVRSLADPEVQAFWNKNTKLLAQHILDARRTDRLMRIEPGMQTAENALNDAWRMNGVPRINTLDDLVNLLVANHPPVPGLNVRAEVLKGLQAELRQYRDHAQAIQTERQTRDSARQSQAKISFSADNEFTKPAAKLELPSSLYDYGALSEGEHVALTARANHERVVSYATAIQRAIRDLESRYERYEKKELTAQQAAGSYGGSIKEMQDVLGLLKKIENDFEQAYSVGSYSTAPRGLVNDTLGLITSAILAMPTVGIRNMTQGQMAVYAMSQAMGTSNQAWTFYRAAKAMPRTLTRFGLHALDGLVKRTNLGAAMITGTNRHWLEDSIKRLGDVIAGEDFRAGAEKVGELGLDGRDSFIERLRRIWQETGEFNSREEQEEKSWPILDKIPGSIPIIGGRKTKRVAAAPFKAMRAFFDKIGVQQYDFAINTAALYNTSLIENRLKEVAQIYGKARENLGPFDPTNRAWDLKSSEWSSAPQAYAEDSLASFRTTLESSVSPEGFQLEDALWRYYQESKTNPQAELFTAPQRDAFQRRILADFNASTPANRPSAASAHGIIRNLLLLQGYPSDQLLKIFNHSMGGVRDRKTVAQSYIKAPIILSLAAMAIVIGYLTSAVTGGWEKILRGRTPALATPLDADFWTNWKRWRQGTLSLAAAQFGYLGDLILGMRGEVIQNRGFDPTGRILAANLMSRFLNAARGSYNTLKGAGNWKDALVPAMDVGRNTLPFWLEIERVLNGTQPSQSQDERIRRGEANVQGMIEGRSGFVPPPYGPTTVVRRNVSDATSRMADAKAAGDQAEQARQLAIAQENVAKLEEYHYQKYLAAGKDPATARALAKRDTWNDYQDLNPAVKALLGRRPSKAQEELILSGISGSRREVVDRGDKAWRDGALALFNRQGVTTREESEAARAGIGGRGIPIAGMRQRSGIRQQPGGGRRRQLSVSPASAPERAVRSRLRRQTEAPLRAQRAATTPRGVRRSVMRQRVPGTRRQRAPGLPGLKRPRVRRRRLGTIRAPEYALR